MTAAKDDEDIADIGPRERNQRETKRRIAEAGLKLFREDGYDETTIDAIAAEAGISRRTFFSYFKSKDELVLVWQTTGWERLRADLLAVSPDEDPLEAVQKTMVLHAAQYESDETRIIDQVTMASETLRSRKQAAYSRWEESLYNTLCQVWRQPERRSALRVVAMVSIGAMRLAIEASREHDGDRPMADFLNEAFANLREVI